MFDTRHKGEIFSYSQLCQIAVKSASSGLVMRLFGNINLELAAGKPVKPTNRLNQ
jgi:hypothetical protein